VSPASSRAEPLSRDEVVAAALELTQRVGVDNLTMRGLAAELGVSPMATYHYVANKEELINLVCEEVGAEWGRLWPSELGRPWDEVLRHHLLVQWETLRRYPGLGTHLMNRPGMGVTSSSYAAGVAFFRAAGFGEREAVLAWSFTETYVHGRLSVDARLHGRDEGLRLDGIRARDHVEYAIDTLIEGLRARLRGRPG
jgi:AcrR family transcriptional regulator